MIQMHKVYIESLTPEVKNMYENFDKDALKGEVLRHADELIALKDDPEFFNQLGRLLVAAGCLDSLKGGRGCAFLCDYINF